jgi:DNA repair photolyase
MKIAEIKAKSIITKSGLNCDYVINPYVGCMHGCVYCYARFMKRFTGHQEEWGKFVDAKINAVELVRKSEKYRGKEIFFSSVTDPYQPVESRYKLTRNVLEKLIPIQPTIAIQSKSDLLVRDIDVFKKFKNIDVGISLSTLDESTQKKIEPRASSPQRRIDALMKLKKAGIHTHVFISPILPEITDWKAIIKATKKYADEIWFENLNLYPSIKANIDNFLKTVDPNLVYKYKEIYAKDSMYWNKVEQEIKIFCKQEKLVYKIYFHHTSR